MINAPNGYILVHQPTNFTIFFSGLEAVRRMNPKVKEKHFMKIKRGPPQATKDLNVLYHLQDPLPLKGEDPKSLGAFDPSYLSCYMGTFIPDEDQLVAVQYYQEFSELEDLNKDGKYKFRVVKGGQGLPTDKLENRFQKNTLTEDCELYFSNLGGRGASQANIRIRCKEGVIFLLYRSFVRIGDDFVRMTDTQVIIDDDLNEVWREFSVREGTGAYLSEQGIELAEIHMLGHFTQTSDVMYPYLKVKKKVVDCIQYKGF